MSVKVVHLKKIENKHSLLTEGGPTRDWFAIENT